MTQSKSILTSGDLNKHIKTDLVDISDVKGRMRKGYASDLVARIEEKLDKAPATKAFRIKCEEPVSPRHLANVLRQRIGDRYTLSSSEPEGFIWVYKNKPK